MTLEEARAVWLLRMGTRKFPWVEQFRHRVGEDKIITEACTVLAKNEQFEFDPVGQYFKIKCKS